MPDPTVEPHPPSAPRRPRRWLGTLVAVVGLLSLAALAWYLTNRPAAAPVAGAAGGPPPVGGGRGAFGGGRGGAPPSTVAVVRARRADVPVLLDSLGTVTPIATVTVRPQVSGVLSQVSFTEGQMVA